MLSTARIGTVTLLGLALFAAFSLSALLTGCCTSDEWKTVPFKQAHLQFMVPGDWTVRFRQPGSDPVTLEDGQTAGDSRASDGAVLTALPVLEDAAMVILVAESDVKPEYFARQVENFIPLQTTTFSSRPEPYAINGLAGYAGEGTGRLPGEDTDVYFRTLVLGVAGRTVLVTLYAEASHRLRYEAIFDRILASLTPYDIPQPVERPDAGPQPLPPTARTDTGDDGADASLADVAPTPEQEPDIPGPEGEDMEPDEDEAPAATPDAGVDAAAAPDAGPASPDGPPPSPDAGPARPDGADVGDDAAPRDASPASPDLAP